MIVAPRIRISRTLLAATVGVSGVIFTFGAIRLDSQIVGADTVRVAAIATMVGPGANGMPSPEVLATNNEDLFAKTQRAAALGARLVAWNECATLVEPSREDAFVERGRIVAAKLGIDLVLAYGAYQKGSLIDNKFVFLTSEGKIAQVYRKHHPVPGEPRSRAPSRSRLSIDPMAESPGPYATTTTSQPSPPGMVGSELISPSYPPRIGKG